MYIRYHHQRHPICNIPKWTGIDYEKECETVYFITRIFSYTNWIKLVFMLLNHKTFLRNTKYNIHILISLFFPCDPHATLQSSWTTLSHKDISYYKQGIPGGYFHYIHMPLTLQSDYIGKHIQGKHIQVHKVYVHL